MSFSIKLKKCENFGFGFSLLGSEGFPHVIYDIVANSPAAECGEVEAGDVIVKVNGTDVHRFSTKEVLKCLRLSEDSVTLDLKRDPKIKAHVCKYLSQTVHQNQADNIPHFERQLSPLLSAKNHEDSNYNLQSPTNQNKKKGMITDSGRKSRIPQIVRGQTVPPVTNHVGSTPQSPVATKSVPQSPTKQMPNHGNGHYHNHIDDSTRKAGFEAYMMTGDVILNLSRTAQTSDLIDGVRPKKFDSLRETANHQLRNSQNSRRSFGAGSRIAQRGAIPDGGNYRKAVMAKCDSSSSPSSPTNDSTEIDEEIEHDDEVNEHICTCRPCRELNDRHDIKICSENCINGGNSIVVGNRRHRSIDNPSPKDLCVTDKVHDRNVYDQNSDSSSSCSRLGTMTSSNSQTSNSSGPRTTTLDDGVSLQHTEMPSSSAEQLISTDNNRDNLLICQTSNNQRLVDMKSDYHSVPVSPTTGGCQEMTVPPSNSMPTSPESSTTTDVVMRRQQVNTNGISSTKAMGFSANGVGSMRIHDPSGFRTSRSEDHLQQSSQREGTIVPIDIDEDLNSSLNTLLDTRHDVNTTSDESQYSPLASVSDRQDRIVWTYNAPIPAGQQPHLSHSSSMSSSSPQHTTTPLSPTNSTVSSTSSSFKNDQHVHQHLSNINSARNNTTNPDASVSEALSNISSPDYQDEQLLSGRELSAMMAVSDPSDSDSTLLVSDMDSNNRRRYYDRDNKIVIHVKPNNPNDNNSKNNNMANHSMGYSTLKDSDEELVTITDCIPRVHQVSANDGVVADVDRDSSPLSDDGSDVDSLHSYHYSPKAVDLPSAIRLAKRLFGLDGFKKSDVSRHLSKNNEFSRAVAEEYLKYFKFEKLQLDEALRKFLQQFSLSGETQERERVLVHFSKRYLDCNPGTFNSQDAVHTLTCAIMLLNTDLHGPNIGRKMTCSEFIENLSDLNDGENFPRDVLKYLFQAIKSHPLDWALDDDVMDCKDKQENDRSLNLTGPQSLLLSSEPSVAAIEYKKGYVMRKCCYDSNNKKTPFGKRSWKMFYCTLRDLVLYLHKDEHGFRKNQLSDNVHNAIRIHHALATKATDYTKKQHVFRLQTADQSEYLFQTSDPKELQSWIDTINYVCASFSAPPLEGGVGNQKRYQRPLLPSSRTKLSSKEQLAMQESKIAALVQEFEDHIAGTVPTKGLALQNYKDKDAYLKYELRRYRAYVDILNVRSMANAEQVELQMVDGKGSLLTESAVGARMENCGPTVLTTASNLNNNSNRNMDNSLDDHPLLNKATGNQLLPSPNTSAESTVALASNRTKEDSQKKM